MDRLYGITMPEKGVSQLVAVDLQKAESMVAQMTKDSFKTRLEIAKKKINKNKNNQKNQKTSNFGEAFKLSTELVAAVAVGTIIGFILDNWFGTKPWLILIFFFVGVIAGISNVIRSAKNMQKQFIREKKWHQIQCTNLMYIELVQK